MTHKQAVLRLLSDHKPHSHHELYSLGCVAHSRISDLRKDGHTIEQWRDGDLYLYRLVGRLDEATSGAGLAVASSSAPSILAPSPPKEPTRPSDSSVASGSQGGGVLTLFTEEAA